MSERLPIRFDADWKREWDLDIATTAKTDMFYLRVHRGKWFHDMASLRFETRWFTGLIMAKALRGPPLDEAKFMFPELGVWPNDAAMRLICRDFIGGPSGKVWSRVS